MAADSSPTTLPSPWAHVVRGEKDTFSVAPPEKSAPAAAATVEICEDNASVVVTKSPWIKPLNGVVEADAPVMGGDTWPTISESTRFSVKSSTSSDSSLKPADEKGTVTLNAHNKQVNSNGNPTSRSNQNTHTHPVRQRPIKRGGGAGGGSGQSAFTRTPPPPTPPPFPIPFGMLPPMMDLPVREPPFKGKNWETRPVGGVGSQSSSGNDHPSQRQSSRRGNFGSRPRGDGMHYNGHGGRRDQDRNWNAHRNSTARDIQMHQMAPPPPPPPPRFMRPGLPGSTPFFPTQHVYGNPMPFEFVRPFLYGPPFPPESLRGVPLIPPPVPPPMVFPLVDPSLPSRIINQIDYYFSDSNLVKDEFLRSKMDGQGWVHISLIASFPRVMSLTSDVQLILDALGASTVVEVQGDKLRRRDNWKKWIPLSRQVDPDLASSSPSESTDEMLKTYIQEMSINDLNTNKVGTMDTVDAQSDIVPGKISSEAMTDQSKVANGGDTSGEV